MSEIEKQAKIKIQKQIRQIEIMLNNIDTLIPDFKELKEKKQEVREHLEEELLIWKIILKNFRKSIYKN